MRYLRFLDRVITENHRTKSFNGFILPSLLISVLISSFVILVIMTICMTCYIWTERIDDSMAMLEDGRYTRRAIVAHIIWNHSMVSINDKGNLLSINDTSRTAFTVTRSRIIGTDDKRKLDAIKPFSMNPNRLVTLKWSINNRFNSQTEYAKGYGGIAQYEVATAVSTHSDWFKKTKHL